MTDKNILKLMESISDDLFRIKLELGLIHIDEISDDYYDTDPDEGGYKTRLNTHFQRMFYCRRELKRYIFWNNSDQKTIKEHIDFLVKVGACEKGERKELQDFIEKMRRLRGMEVQSLEESVIKNENNDPKKFLEDFLGGEMCELNSEKDKLSRIAFLDKRGLIEWKYDLLKQLQEHCSIHKNFDKWEYKAINPFDVSITRDLGSGDLYYL